VTKHKAIICDLDGCLADNTKRKNGVYDASNCDVEDTVVIPVAVTVRALALSVYYIVFCSGREDKYREPTVRFIDNCFPWMNGDYALFMRQTKDQRKDYIVKRKIYEEQIAHRFDVLLVLDDRASVVKDCWRAFGLTCFQVAEGNF
jgi:hypothetical protein